MPRDQVILGRGIPDKMIVSFRTSEFMHKTVTTTKGEITLKWNSLFNQFGASSTHLTSYVRFWAHLYVKYVVIGARLRVRAVTEKFDSTDTTRAGYAWGIHDINTETVANTLVMLMIEQGHTQWRLVDAGIEGSTSLVSKYSPREVFGATSITDDLQWGSLSESSPYASSPTSLAEGIIWNIAQDSGNADVCFEATLDQTVVLFNSRLNEDPPSL